MLSFTISLPFHEFQYKMEPLWFFQPIISHLKCYFFSFLLNCDKIKSDNQKSPWKQKDFTTLLSGNFMVLNYRRMIILSHSAQQNSNFTSLSPRPIPSPSLSLCLSLSLSLSLSHTHTHTYTHTHTHTHTHTNILFHALHPFLFNCVTPLFLNPKPSLASLSSCSYA